MKNINGGWLILLSLLVVLSNCQNDISRNETRMGVIQQLTGQMSKYGKTQVAAVNAMVETINHQRVANKLPMIKLVVDDDQLQPAKGVSIIQKMIATDKVVAIIGAQGSSVTLAMAPIAEQNKVVLISGASGSPKISDAGDYVFRTCPSDVYEAAYTAKIYEQMYGKQSLAILYINNDYGIGLRDAFLESLKAKPSVLLTLGFQQGASDLRSQLAEIRKSEVQVIYLVGYEEMITVFRQAKELGVKCQWLGNNQLNDQTMVDKLGNTADGTLFPGHAFDLEQVKQKYPEFYRRYMELSNGVELDIFAAYGADALMAINHVLVNETKTGEDIKNALYGIQDFEGITGKFSFNSKGDAIRELVLYQIQDGKIVKYQPNMTAATKVGS